MRAEVELPPKLVPVFSGKADTRGAHGGRGSAKSRSFAKMTAVRVYKWDKEGRTGIILCGRQFQNSIADSSLEEIKTAIGETPWLEPHFDIGETYIRTKSGRISYTFSGLDRNIDSIKSKARILLAWIEEAENVTEEAWVKLIPTLREEDSELWITWNPESKRSATNKRFHTKQCKPDKHTRIVEMNYTDNPWFPEILERKRLKDKEDQPVEKYEHIWEGKYLAAVEGAYFARQLQKAREDGRVGFFPADPHQVIRLYADIGGTGAKADNFVFWAQQVIGGEIRWVDHYEVQGQDIAYHLNWLRERGYEPGRAKIWLPHDGATNDKVINVSYETAFRGAGYDVTVIANQGPGAAMGRVEKARELFGKMRFHEELCGDGLDALSWYHPKISKDDREMDLGPNHDWASHSADAFGAGCIAYEPPRSAKPLDMSKIGVAV